ncbi:hypothetical protein COY52_01785 [Candidatus Desantisbacteria bacterium CG_4_10_14_0_8_um_filter_48_22]|uniref:N-acetyltransferase domain-containing protein n=1 Tax=Candidatus Desantisbacteria bacterium CG_4_10_14_0_8_um_filter_48_22 TaxID=1974543 RepID=A0A2M7SEL8_9BACT|nr:MAG: hypothetical protein AUJ67_07535 [Candidatus Desantisbacteria bacterium CG1_02_49_89]PIV57216.1 MAG: hypothetical protein COS16_01505 [Candidatus Desantisbacteria bacterium CG02_land_8_20_14_3_00_49_13]PIZ17975.1 MAG: hypothetical protein COY52_01785 [Candidatus Desantisbacteria bacterium CG_4_10_14_0_8_um_filter_48_22]
MERKQPQLVMKRNNLEDLPAIVLPQGYSIRTYKEGDGEAWCDIINRTIGPGWNADLFNTSFLQFPVFSPDRMFFVVCGGIPAGTATAWVKEPEEKVTGIVHYVGVLPEHAGRKLGYALTLRTLHYMKDHGFKNAVLQTDDDRLPAIKTYLNLGFVPTIIDDNQYQRWMDIFRYFRMNWENYL